ncbi:hypothetical protein PoB_001648800 [Plakobranchus ocellatus]|uniref:Uncharacterized protein n=1 Tax=Plakobranchus ocellatus TaxID=259542 RepID=A0AAV3Z5N1_9GAST|nr:hypothetical protein PoB_001648800 [Plakobranchus ocellatus]
MARGLVHVGLEIDWSSKVREAPKVRGLILVGIANDGNGTVHKTLTLRGWGQGARGQHRPKGPHSNRCTCGDRNPQPHQLSRSLRSERSRMRGGSNRLSRSLATQVMVDAVVEAGNPTRTSTFTDVNAMEVQRVTEVTKIGMQRLQT